MHRILSMMSLALAATTFAGCGAGTLAADVEWGPEKDGIAVRLLPLQDTYVLGGPMRFRLELKNETSTPMHFDKQGLRERCLAMTGPDGERAPYIGHSYCTTAFYRFAEPGETVTLRTVDARQYFFVGTPGRYAVSYDLGGFRVSDKDRGIYWKWRPYKKPGEPEPRRVSGLATNTLNIDVLPGELAPWQVAVGRLLEVLRGRWTVSGVSGGEGLTPKERELSIRAEICLNAHVSHHGTGITIWETGRRVDPASLGQAWRGITNEYWGENARGHVYVRIPPSQEYIWPDAREKIAAALDVADTVPPTPDEVARVIELREALKAGDANKVGILVQAHPGIVNAQLHRHHVGKGVWLGGMALHWAAQMGDTATTATLLKHDADIEAVYSECRSTPLHCAARAGHRGLVALLLERGAEVDAKDRDGRTALYEAAQKGHADVVALLLGCGAAVNVVTENLCKRTPLLVAAERGHVDVVGALLARGADLKAVTSSYYWTPLHFATFKGHGNVVELLLAKVAEIEATDKKGRPPLDLAEEKGHKEIAERLRRHGED